MPSCHKIFCFKVNLISKPSGDTTKLSAKSQTKFKSLSYFNRPLYTSAFIDADAESEAKTGLRQIASPIPAVTYVLILADVISVEELLLQDVKTKKKM